MADTKQNVIDEFTRMVPKCDQTQAGKLFDRAFDSLAFYVPIRRSAFDQPLLAGVSQYALTNKPAGEEVRRIFSVYLNNTSNVPTRALGATTVEYLDAMEPNWRQHAEDPIAGEPGRWYWTNDTVQPYVGLDYIPTSQFIATYPKMRIYTGQIKSPLLTTDTVPATLVETNVLRLYMRWQFSMENDPQNSPYWHQTYRDALGETERKFVQFNASIKPRILPEGRSIRVRPA